MSKRDRNPTNHDCAEDRSDHDVCQQCVTPGDETLDAALRETVAWGCETFPNADPASCAAHLLREAVELCDDPTSAEEMADVVMLLAHTAHHAGVDLAAAVRAKLKVNRARTWGEPDSDGVIEHLR